MAFDTTISLIIATYNNPDYLELVLISVLRQRILPEEVIIADDGSKEETGALIQQYSHKFPVPLIHVWHEDNGYRLAAIKNKSAAKASKEYIIFIDGDLALHPYFIYDYKKNLRENAILVASRAFLTEAFSLFLVENKQHPVTFFWKNFEQNRFSAIRVPWLHYFIKGSRTYKGARGGLMGIFRKDYIKVNGFDEAFTGWGREDSDLFVRIINSGIKRDNIKFAAITYHLWHKILSRDNLNTNDALLEKAIKENKKRCENGINKYL